MAYLIWYPTVFQPISPNFRLSPLAVRLLLSVFRPLKSPTIINNGLWLLRINITLERECVREGPSAGDRYEAYAMWHGPCPIFNVSAYAWVFTDTLSYQEDIWPYQSILYTLQKSTGLVQRIPSFSRPLSLWTCPNSTCLVIFLLSLTLHSMSRFLWVMFSSL